MKNESCWVCASLDGKHIYNISDTADEAIAKSEKLADKGLLTISKCSST